jgi:hypothetical protein
MTEPSDLARLAAGVPVATLMPLCLPRTGRDSLFGTALAATLAALVAIPVLPDAAAFVALIAPPVIAAIELRLRRGSRSNQEPNTPRMRAGLAIVAPAPLATVACVALLQPEEAWDALAATIESNEVAIVASGALAAIFLGGPLVAWVLSPFAKSLRSDRTLDSTNSLEQAGTLIGWCERALFFAFIVGGQPQAAAVALAAKSFARFPSLSKHEEGFAEYFLIGTLASLVVALGIAVGVRAALGLSAF